VTSSYDVIIIGSGAGGGTLAHRLAPSGKRILAHQAGTCRFGNDPRTSVLDADCKAHELDNLYVVDTSFFPSIGAVNPALTAMANGLRVGDHLLQRLAATPTHEAAGAL
jgi:choline dehydrogenase-like flavoprotein